MTEESRSPLWHIPCLVTIAVFFLWLWAVAWMVSVRIAYLDNPLDWIACLVLTFGISFVTFLISCGVAYLIRKWSNARQGLFHLHLLTLVLLVLTAGVLLGLNLWPRPYHEYIESNYYVNGRFYRSMDVPPATWYGWPFPVAVKAVEGIFRAKGLAGNVIVACGIVAMVGVCSEKFLRRNSGNEQGERHLLWLSLLMLLLLIGLCAFGLFGIGLD